MLILYSYFYLKQRANKFSFPLLGFVIFVAYYFLWEKFLFLRVTIRSFSFARKLISVAVLILMMLLAGIQRPNRKYTVLGHTVI